MHLLALLCWCSAGALVITAAPPASPVTMSTDADPGVEAAFTSRQEMTNYPTEYQDETEYGDILVRVPVLLLTPGELDDIFGDVQYRYGEEAEEHEEDEESDINGVDITRSKRQVAQEAMALSLSHTDRNGNNRPVGRIHGRFDLNGIRNNRNNHHTQAGLGLGSVVYRSRNGRHSLGVGAYGTQGRGRSFGYGYKTRPQWGAGVGYRFRF